MGTRSSSLCSVLLVFCLLPFSIIKADDFKTYTSFVKCMQKRTKPDEDIGSLIFYSSNSTFGSVLEAYGRNARFNTDSVLKPLLIVTAKKISHLQATVFCAQRAAPGYVLKTRSGGNDYDALSYTSTVPFLMVDMFNLRSITSNREEKTAWVQAGATLGEVYHSIWKTSNLLGFPAGVCTGVAIGGTVSAAGYGNLLRKFGLSVDNVVDAQVVDANGRLLNRSTMGEDYFWAIRGGGGGSFGIVVAYKLNLLPVPATVTVFLKKLPEQNAANILYDWQNVAPVISDDLFMRAIISSSTAGVNVTVRALYLGKADSLVKLLNTQFPSLGLTASDCMEMPWIQSVIWWAEYSPFPASPSVLLQRKYGATVYRKRKSDYVTTPISVSGFKALFAKMKSLGKTELKFNPYGGKMNQFSSSAVPFPHRAGNLYKIQYVQDWNVSGKAADDENMNRVRELYAYMTPYVSKNPRSSYLNYRDVDIGIMPPGVNSVSAGRVYGEKYFKGNFDRLVKIKTAVDPRNFFRNEQGIPTL